MTTTSHAPTLSWGTSSTLEERGISALPIPDDDPVVRAILSVFRLLDSYDRSGMSAAERAVAHSTSRLMREWIALNEPAFASDPTTVLARRATGLKAINGLSWLCARHSDPAIRAIAARYEES
jgi:hypothetical protein